jgi:hypothetical protein
MSALKLLVQLGLNKYEWRLPKDIELEPVQDQPVPRGSSKKRALAVLEDLAVAASSGLVLSRVSTYKVQHCGNGANMDIVQNEKDIRKRYASCEPDCPGWTKRPIPVGDHAGNQVLDDNGKPKYEEQRVPLFDWIDVKGNAYKRYQEFRLR